MLYFKENMSIIKKTQLFSKYAAKIIHEAFLAGSGNLNYMGMLFGYKDPRRWPP